MRLALPCLLLLVTAVPAQVQIPSSSPETGNYFNFAMFYGTTSSRIKNEGHGIALYDVKDITPPGAVFKTMQVRRSTRVNNFTNRATTVDLTIIMSVSPRVHTSISRSFAANHGTNKTTVFNGKVNMPQRAGSSFPGPWEAPIPFSKPFPYANQMGKSLVIETITANNTAKRTWNIEGSKPDTGNRKTVRSSCNFAAGGRNSSISFTTFITIGRSIRFWFNNYPKGMSSWPAVLVWGTKTSGNWAGFPLPIKFSTLGLAVNDPNCALATDVAATSTLNYDSSRGRLVMPSSVPLPNNPALVGQSFVNEPVSVDTSGASPGLHGGWSNRWTIGSGKEVPARYVYRTGDNSNPSGFRSLFNFTPTVLLK